MKSDLVNLFVAYWVHLLLLVFAILFGFILHAPLTFVPGIIVILFSSPIGRVLLSKITGPNTGMRLLTSNIGISFACISIDLFRQGKSISNSEQERLCKYFASEFGQEVYGVANGFIQKNKDKKVNLFSHTKLVCSLKHNKRVLFLFHLLSMAMADGKYTKEEDEYLQQISRLIKVSKRNFLIIKSNFVKEENQKNSDYSEKQSDKKTTYFNSKNFSSQFFSPLNNAYLILGVSKYSNFEEIKKQYRKLVKIYHPDILSNHSDIEIKKANSKLQEINEAYEIIKANRGLK